MSAARKINYPVVLWRRRWLILALLVLGLAGGFAVFLKMTRVYRAAAMVTYIPQAISTKVYGGGPARRAAPNRVREIRSHVQNWPFLEMVATRMKMEAPTRDDLRDLNDRFDIVKMDPENFRFTFVHRDASRAAEGANAFASAFVEDFRRKKLDRAGGNLGFVEDDIARISGELDVAEKALVAYQSAHKGELPSDRETHRSEQAFLRTRLAELNAQIATRTKDRDQRREMLDQPAGTAGTVPGRSPGVGLLIDPRQQQVESLRTQLADARLRYTDKHPQVVRLQANLDRLLDQIRTHAAPVASMPAAPVATAPVAASPDPTQGRGDALSHFVRIEIDRLNTEIQDLAAKKKQETDRLDELSRLIEASFAREADLGKLTSKINVLRGRLTAKQGLQQTLETELQVFERDMDERYAIKTAAGVPLLPYRPDIVQLLLIGLLAGTAAGVGLAVVLEFFDSTVHGAEEIEALLGVDVVSCIPHMEASTRRSPATARDGKKARHG
ncbi:MAG: GumC family protein [Acidobacteriota bacterium]